MSQLIISGGTAPATPSTAQVTVYAKSADKKLYYKDDAGLENALSAQAGVETLTNKTLTGPKETKTAPTISTGTLALDCATGSLFSVSLNAAITNFTIANIPATGTLYGFILEFTADGTPRTVDWAKFKTAAAADSSVEWASATAPTLTSTSGKRDVFVFFTHDAGTTWTGIVSAQNL